MNTTAKYDTIQSTKTLKWIVLHILVGVNEINQSINPVFKHQEEEKVYIKH